MASYEPDERAQMAEIKRSQRANYYKRRSRERFDLPSVASLDRCLSMLGKPDCRSDPTAYRYRQISSVLTRRRSVLNGEFMRLINASKVLQVITVRFNGHC